MLEILLVILSLIAPNNSSLKSHLSLAVQNPNKFFLEYPITKARLLSSSNPSKDPKMPWLALIDILCENDLAIELDWKTEPTDVELNLKHLIGFNKLSPSFKQWLKQQTADENMKIDTGLFLQAISKRLNQENYSLACLVMESDSYVVVIVPSSSLSKLKEQAKLINRRIEDLSRTIP